MNRAGKGLAENEVGGSMRSRSPFFSAVLAGSLAALSFAVLAACGTPGRALSLTADGKTAAAAGWASWTRHAAPVFEGHATASDPTIVREGSRLLMVATDLDVATNRTDLVAATSADGLAWQFAATDGPQAGLVLVGRDGKWDENLETPELARRGSTYLLYYCGYRDGGTPIKGFPAALGLATSTDGRHFRRVSDDPILRPTPGWYDNDAVYSPTIVNDGSGWVMLYVGHAYTKLDKIGGRGGVYLLAATSPDGIAWTKRPTPVISPGGALPWMRDGAAEPALVKAPDGAWYLFFTGLSGEDRVIGVARGASPFGPWQIDPAPIVAPSDAGFDARLVLAPYVIIDGTRARLWYLGSDDRERIRVGYAETAWPIYRPPTAPSRSRP